MNITAENNLNTQLRELSTENATSERARIDAERNAIDARQMLALKERELEIEILRNAALQACLTAAGDDLTKIEACIS